MAELDKKALLDFLHEVDEVLKDGIRVVAVGGTVLTLMDLKTSTRDVDLTGPQTSIRALKDAIRRLNPGFRVDAWEEGRVFMIGLPQDYVKRSRLVIRMRRLELRHAHPVDVIVTKLARYDERDQEDIRDTIRKYRPKPGDIRRRAANVQYAGNEDMFKANLDHCLQQMRLKKARTGSSKAGGRASRQSR